MVRGRKPKPTHLKLLNGNPGKRALNQNEPKPRPVRPVPPDYLLPAARAEWDRVAPELEHMGVLTVVDMAALAIYCQAWARMLEAEAQIVKFTSVLRTASGYVQVSPFETLRKQNAHLVRAFCAEFGMTPSARSRMTVPGDASDAECPKCTMPLELCGC